MKIAPFFLQLQFVCLLSSCALPRASFQTMSDIGNVASVRVHSEAPMQNVPASVVVPVGGVAIPVKIGPLPIARRMYIYEVQLAQGKIVQTQSDREFALGDCVRLWHAGAVEAANEKYNFVQGTLEADRECVTVAR